MKWTSGFFSICIFLCATFSSKGNEFGQDAALHRGDSLFALGNFFEAAIAYERAYFFSAGQQQKTAANLRKAAALKQMGEHARVVTDLQRSLPFAGDEALRREILYEMAFSAYLSWSYPLAQSLISQLEFQSPQGVDIAAFPLLKSLVMVKMENWEALRDYSGNLFPGNEEDSEKKQMQQILLLLLEDANHPQSLDPPRARLWSTFFPGAGQVYAGSPGKGALNGFSQLVSLSGAVLMAYNQLYISSVVVGLGLFQSFYFGGIRQAGQLAEENSFEQMAQYKDKLSAILIEIHKPDQNTQ